MRLTLPIAFLFLAAAPAPAHQPAAASPSPAATTPRPTLALSGGRWFDGSGFVAGEWYSVDGRLTRTRPARIDATVDLSGRYVLPPFTEAHNHDMQNGRFAAISNGKNLRAGVFYSVQMCSRPDQRADFAGFFGGSATVDVLYADACISSPDGHPLGIALSSARQAGVTVTPEEGRRFYDPVETIADLDRLWPQILERRPRLIKFILINSERRDSERAIPARFGFMGLDPALAAPLVARAHAAGIRVAAHADSAADFAIAVADGVDIVAHLPGYRIAEGFAPSDYRISDAVIAEAARRGTVVITTAVVASNHLSRHPQNAAALRAMQIENLTRLRAAGVALALGSDAVMGTVVDEVLYLDGLNIMPRAELLRRATADTARAMFPDRQIGLFREGAEASLVVYGANPIEDIEALRTPQILIKNGGLIAP
jgi:imidazolonepropionase-like amidohydrolase